MLGLELCIIPSRILTGFDRVEFMTSMINTAVLVNVPLSQFGCGELVTEPAQGPTKN